MAEKFDEFIDEIEKDIRQERFEKLWKEYGKAASIGIIAILGISSSWFFWNKHQDNQLKLTSEKFIKAQSLVERGDISAGLGVYDSIIADQSKTYSALAQIAKAAVLFDKGGEDARKAADQLSKLTADSKADPIMRDFASIAIIRNDIELLNIQSLNDETKAKLKAHLAKLETLSTEKSPWRLMALDLKGIIFFILNDYAKASDVYISIAQTEGCPRGILARAEIMSQLALKNMQTTTQPNG
jgi:hypothetical protein